MDLPGHDGHLWLPYAGEAQIHVQGTWASKSIAGDRQIFPRQDGSTLGLVCLKYERVGKRGDLRQWAIGAIQLCSREQVERRHPEGEEIKILSPYPWPKVRNQPMRSDSTPLTLAASQARSSWGEQVVSDSLGKGLQGRKDNLPCPQQCHWIPLNDGPVTQSSLSTADLWLSWLPCSTCEPMSPAPRPSCSCSISSSVLARPHVDAVGSSL